MKKIMLSMAALSALAIGAPAAAQYQDQNQNRAYPGQYGANANANGNIAMRIDQLRVRLQTGIQSGAITRSEAVPLRQQLRALTQLERQYRINGFTGQERSMLQQRLRTLRQQIRAADGGRGRYGDDNWDNEDRNGQYDRDDRMDRNNDGYDDRDYDRDGRWDDDVNSNGRIDANNDGYDDRDYDRDGRWDDDANTQGGVYQQPAPRTGIGGLIDSVLGTGGLRVGQRAPDNLYGLPSGYQNQYRDGNGVYYRSDGRQIYQIDARNRTVIRVIPMSR